MTRSFRFTRLLSLVLVLSLTRLVLAGTRVPAGDAEVIAELPVGVHFRPLPAQQLASTRLDVAVALAQMNVSRAHTTGDMRFLGYAEAVLDPWMKQAQPAPQVLVLNATILQSRHAFDAALGELDQALTARPEDAQAWLSKATILRVLGRYDEALQACRQLQRSADQGVSTLCDEGVRGLSGHLQEAYAAILRLPDQALSPTTRTWRFSELGEMAERLGNDEAAESWFRAGLAVTSTDFYIRTAYADLLLRRERAGDALALLAGCEAIEPLLLRAAIAHQLLKDHLGSPGKAQLAAVFQMEQQRGDAVHRRELARYWLDVEHAPNAALAAARENWQVQREPDDLVLLLRAANEAGRPEAAAAARRFLSDSHLEDARLDPFRGGT